MSAAHRDEPEQEISIRRRDHELFRRQAEELPGAPARTFAEYLRDTPPAPLSQGIRAVLWALAVVVALLFAAALWRSAARRAPEHAPKRSKSAPGASAITPAPPIARATTTPRSNRITRLPASLDLENRRS